MTTVKTGTFSPVHKFMAEGGLRGAELLVYAFLYPFTNGQVGVYYGSKRYIAESLGISLRSVFAALSSLLKKGWIEKRSDELCRGIRCLVHEAKEDCSSSEKGSAPLRDKEPEASDTQDGSALQEKSAPAYKKPPFQSSEAEAHAPSAPKSEEKPEAKSGRISPAFRDLFRDEPDDDELPLYIRIMDEVREKPIYNTIDLGHRSESVHLSERQYRELLRLVSPEQLTVYLRKLQLMLDRNLNTLRPSPHNHYKLLRKWITMDLGT